MLRNLSVVAFASVLAAGLASASPSCMTRQEARAAYPKAWLYWHGKEKCWDNQRGRGRSRKQYRNPVMAADASGPPAVLPPAENFYILVLVPSIDVFLRFMPWEQRIGGYLK